MRTSWTIWVGPKSSDKCPYKRHTEKVEWWFQGLVGGGNGEVLLNGYRVSVMQDKKVLEICSTQCAHS